MLLSFTFLESGVCATPKPDDQGGMNPFDLTKYDDDAREKLHKLNLMILEKFIKHFPKLKGINGIQAIPFMQVGYYNCLYSFSFLFLFNFFIFF